MLVYETKGTDIYGRSLLFLKNHPIMTVDTEFLIWVCWAYASHHKKQKVI